MNDLKITQPPHQPNPLTAIHEALEQQHELNRELLGLLKETQQAVLTLTTNQDRVVEELLRLREQVQRLQHGAP